MFFTSHGRVQVNNYLYYLYQQLLELDKTVFRFSNEVLFDLIIFIHDTVNDLKHIR